MNIYIFKGFPHSYYAFMCVVTAENIMEAIDKALEEALKIGLTDKEDDFAVETLENLTQWLYSNVSIYNFDAEISSCLGYWS